jgi:hypothetical protein
VAHDEQQKLRYYDDLDRGKFDRHRFLNHSARAPLYLFTSLFTSPNLPTGVYLEFQVLSLHFESGLNGIKYVSMFHVGSIVPTWFRLILLRSCFAIKGPPFCLKV